jgi:hypothetical protein
MTAVFSDWYEIVSKEYNIRSANDVPWPLDDYLELQRKPTTYETARLVKMLGGMGRMNDRAT